MSETTIAFLGLGNMGRGMVKSLLRAGFRLRVWDRTPGRVPPGAGLEEAASPAEAVRGVPFVMTSLANDQAVREVVLGERGFLPAMDAGAVHIGVSTISWSLAKDLVKLHADRGTHYLGSPVLGRPDAAERGELTVIAGGEAEVVTRCQGVLAGIGKTIIPADSPPAAHLVKIIANMMLASTIEMLGEATALGEKGGIAPDQLIEMLGKTLMASTALRTYGSKIVHKEFEPAGFRLELGLKDVSLALAAGDELRAPLPLASLVHDHFVEAVARGRAQQDWSALAAVAREAAGLS
jgi:3-hydroxyisobutyrate dehydrogenase-like beta-hydroxyacid dehydrogenase